MRVRVSFRPKERANILDDFDHCVIKRTIHGLYSRKIAPTVSIMHKEIKDSIKISKSKLTLTLIDLGYTYKKIGCSFNNTMIKVVQNVSSFFGSIWHTRPLTIHNTVHWSVRHTQSFRCPLIYPIKWDNWLLRCIFLTKKGKQLFYKLLAFRR
jgi:hypothetical protein